MARDFEAIDNDQAFTSGLAAIAESGLELARVVIGQELGINTVTFFSQTPEEYDFIAAMVRRYGPVSSVSHGATLYIDSDFSLLSYHIRYLGVRQPDETRPERGYVDYPVPNYRKWLKEAEAHRYMSVIVSGRGQSLIELTHPDFNVRGHLVAAEEH